jgi:hypothetical protein
VCTNNKLLLLEGGRADLIAALQCGIINAPRLLSALTITTMGFLPAAMVTQPTPLGPNTTPTNKKIRVAPPFYTLQKKLGLLYELVDSS